MWYLAIVITIKYFNYQLIWILTLVLWPLVASLTRQSEHFPSWTRNGHEHRAFSLKRRTTQLPWYGQHNSHVFPNLQLCKWGLFCPPGMLRHLLFSCSLFVILQDWIAFFLWGRRFRGQADDCACRWELFMHWGCDLGMLAVPCLLQPCETESGS